MSNQRDKVPSPSGSHPLQPHPAGSAEGAEAQGRDAVIVIASAQADRERIKPLVAAIEARGYRTWTDADLAAGESWREEIDRVIASARCVLVVLTAKSAASEWQRAVAAASNAVGKLIPVRLDPVPLPVHLADVQTADLTGWDGQLEHPALAGLLVAVERIAGPPSQPLDRPASLGKPTLAPTRRIRVPDIAWVEIPDGPFLYQDGERHELPTFWIAKYPLTNVQYQCFIDDGGYKDDRWWRDLRRPEPRAPRWPQPNCPRTDVDWYEAVAFCRWLSARLALPKDSIRLPTELEWERAARGKNGLRYPWGDEYRSGFANVDETNGGRNRLWYLRQVTAVGVYPHGRSPEGVEDLAGTIWEWCLNKHANAAAIEPDTSGAVRALRGGSWRFHSDGARADKRDRDSPATCYGDRGFRLLSSVPIDAVR